MSRYTINPTPTKTISYGFDHVMFYFYQEFEDITKVGDITLTPELVIADYDYHMHDGYDYFGHVELYELLLPYKHLIPDEHMNAIAGDLPF